MATIPDRIHILGASGSGTTSLGASLAEEHGHRHLDTDDYYWLPYDPPYTQKRPPEERLRLLNDDLDRSQHWVLSGSLVGWGDSLIPEFELVVFLTVPTDVRLSRLRARETERYGPTAVAPGGSRHEAMRAFLEWASRYDGGDLDMRSRARHDEWLLRVTCPVLRIDGDASVADQVLRIEDEHAKLV